MSKERAGLARPMSFAVLAVIVAAVCWIWFFPLNSSAGSSPGPDKPVYYEMDSMVVNISKTGSSNRYLKVKPVLVIGHEPFLKEIRHYSPVIRSRLISLYSRESVSSLLAEDGYDGLREKSLVEVLNVIEGKSGDDAVSEVLFNEYVIQ